MKKKAVRGSLDKGITPIGLTSVTASSAGQSCGQSCSPYVFETERDTECHDCSKSIAEVDLEYVKHFKENITAAAEYACFDPSLIGSVTTGKLKFP